ncbi:MAG TPA: NAD kinase [Afifellaceae bacterium]|nr:NAD kinase [Afifellaceae bacterium]
MDSPTAETSSSSLAIMASDAPEAAAAAQRLRADYGDVPPEDADVIVALGGDGLMLQMLHRFMNMGKPIYGMNRGSVGFLMNEYSPDRLRERIAVAKTETIHPLTMTVTTSDGGTVEAQAINEVSLLRQSYQAAKLRISIDGKVRLEELICDGVLVATPAGSTAYNLSAHGPIIPINAPLLALTPISPFRPRRWRGALLPDHVTVDIAVLEADKRPVNAVADHVEFKSVQAVTIREDRQAECLIMFDVDHSWDERILTEQFRY